MPTAGRIQLERALRSVIPYLGSDDELLVVGDGEQPHARQICERLAVESGRKRQPLLCEYPGCLRTGRKVLCHGADSLVMARTCDKHVDEVVQARLSGIGPSDAAWPDERIRYWEHFDPESSFGWAQRNSAMSQATGDMLAFLDDDDTWLPNALASIRREATETICQRPLIFRREYRRRIDVPGRFLEQPVTIQWTREELIDGEIGTGMLAVPRLGGLWCEIPMAMTKIRSGHTDFIWIKHMHDNLWAPDQAKFCRDIIYCCYGHGCGRKESAG